MADEKVPDETIRISTESPLPNGAVYGFMDVKCQSFTDWVSLSIVAGDQLHTTVEIGFTEDGRPQIQIMDRCCEDTPRIIQRIALSDGEWKAEVANG